MVEEIEADTIVRELGYDPEVISSLGSMLAGVTAGITTKSVVSRAARTGQAAITTANSGMHDLVDLTRIDPLCISDQSLRSWEHYDDLLNFGLNVVSSYYLRSVAMLSIDKSIDGIQILRSLKPSIRLQSHHAVNAAIGVLVNAVDGESMLQSFGLPTMEVHGRREAASRKGGFSIQSGSVKGSKRGRSSSRTKTTPRNNGGIGGLRGKAGKAARRNSTGKSKGNVGIGGLRGSKKTTPRNNGGIGGLRGKAGKATAHTPPEQKDDRVEDEVVSGGRERRPGASAGGMGDKQDSIALGKVLRISVRAGSKQEDVTVDLDVVVTLTIKHLQKDTWVALGGMKNINRRLFSGWQSGERSLREVLDFQGKAAGKHKADKRDNKVLSEIRRRRDDAKASAVLHGHAHYGVISSVIMISSETAGEIEDEMNINLDKEAHREKFMDVLEALILLIVDHESDYIWAYYRGVPLSTELTSKHLKKMNGGGDQGLEKILTALLVNKPPRL